MAPATLLRSDPTPSDSRQASPGGHKAYTWQNLPTAITKHSHFAFFRYVGVPGKEKPTKEPRQVRSHNRKARATDLMTWARFEQAVRVYNRLADTPNQPDGLLFALTTGVRLIGFDLDNCVDEHGTIDPEVQAILDRLVGYKELSPSRRGVRCIVAGGSRKLDERGRHVGNIEIYNHARFLSLTGWTLPGSAEPTVSMTDQVRAIVADLDAKQAASGASSSGRTAAASTGTSPVLADEEVITKCRAASNSAKFTALFDSGDLRLYDGNDSDADMALAGILVFYTQDPAQAERLMRMSALRREKWDRHRTYLGDTITKAITNLRACYTGSGRRRPLPYTTAVTSSVTTAIDADHRSSAGTAADPAARIAELEAEVARLRPLEANHEVLRTILGSRDMKPDTSVRWPKKSREKGTPGAAADPGQQVALMWTYEAVGYPNSPGADEWHEVDIEEMSAYVGVSRQTLASKFQSLSDGDRPLIRYHAETITLSNGKHKTISRIAVLRAPEQDEVLPEPKRMTEQREKAEERRRICRECGHDLATVKRVRAEETTCTRCGTVNLDKPPVASKFIHSGKGRERREQGRINAAAATEENVEELGQDIGINEKGDRVKNLTTISTHGYTQVVSVGGDDHRVENLNPAKPQEPARDTPAQVPQHENGGEDQSCSQPRVQNRPAYLQPLVHTYPWYRDRSSPIQGGAGGTADPPTDDAAYIEGIALVSEVIRLASALAASAAHALDREVG